MKLLNEREPAIKEVTHPGFKLMTSCPLPNRLQPDSMPRCGRLGGTGHSSGTDCGKPPACLETQDKSLPLREARSEHWSFLTLPSFDSKIQFTAMFFRSLALSNNHRYLPLPKESFILCKTQQNHEQKMHTQKTTRLPEHSLEITAGWQPPPVYLFLLSSPVPLQILQAATSVWVLNRH